MTLDEIAALNMRIDSLTRAFNERIGRVETLVYLAIGAGLGSGAITLSQVVG